MGNYKKHTLLLLFMVLPKHCTRQFRYQTLSLFSMQHWKAGRGPVTTPNCINKVTILQTPGLQCTYFLWHWNLVGLSLEYGVQRCAHKIYPSCSHHNIYKCEAGFWSVQRILQPTKCLLGKIALFGLSRKCVAWFHKLLSMVPQSVEGSLLVVPRCVELEGNFSASILS